MPSEATATVNFRIRPGDTADGVVEHVRTVVNDPEVEVVALGGWSREPSRVSDSNSKRFADLRATVSEVFPDVVVAPSLVIAGTDSRHYADIADNSYRFMPMRLTREDLTRLHGTTNASPSTTTQKSFASTLSSSRIRRSDKSVARVNGSTPACGACGRRFGELSCVEMVDGSTHPSYAPLAAALKKQLRRTSGGAALCVYQQGRCVADIWGGNKDSKGTPWAHDTMSVSFSTTKGVASTALHLVADRGLIDYDKPVATYWPEFAQAGKGHITVRQVLCHQAGLHDIRNIVDHADRLLDWEHMVEALAAANAARQPKTGSAYHALTYGWLIGEMIKRVTGQSFPEFIESELAGPLQMDGFYVGAPLHQLHRAARLVETVSAPLSERRGRRERRMRLRMERALRLAGVRVNITKLRDSLAPPGVADFDFSSDRVLSAAIPSANGLFTARSLARMYAALAGGGTLDGVRLLSEKTLERATRQHVRGRDHHLMVPMGWRLGYHQVFTTRGVPKRAFGHYGFGGSGAWADPKRQLSFAMTLNDGVGSPLTASLRTARMSAIALGCASDYARSRPTYMSAAAA